MTREYELKKSSNGKYYFNLKSGNGEIILSSEMYEKKSGAENGIESVKINSSDFNRYETRMASNGKPYFILKAKNGQVIGKSEIYSSCSSMKSGIESVKANGPHAPINDLS